MLIGRIGTVTIDIYVLVLCAKPWFSHYLYTFNSNFPRWVIIWSHSIDENEVPERLNSMSSAVQQAYKKAEN